MVYIDLNMVRAGVVAHPSEWAHAGYNEIQSLHERYRCIDIPALVTLLGFTNTDCLRHGLREWADHALAEDSLERDPVWTNSIAAGKREFLDAIGGELQISHPQRIIEENGDYLCLREEPGPYLP